MDACRRYSYAAASLAVLVAGTLVLGACGQREQVAEAKRGYQGKPDGKPWENAPLAYDSPQLWKQGDQASWQEQIKRRQRGQHEDIRIRE